MTLTCRARARVAQVTPFIPPKKPLRLSRLIDLAFPNDPKTQKRRLSVPVSTLPLQSPDAVHRLKLLAGSRWTPGRLETNQLEFDEGNQGYNGGAKDIGKDGWLSLTCHKFEEARMNRKFLSDTLERLVEAANVSLEDRRLEFCCLALLGVVTSVRDNVMAGLPAFSHFNVLKTPLPNVR